MGALLLSPMCNVDSLGCCACMNRSRGWDLGEGRSRQNLGGRERGRTDHICHINAV